MANYQGNVSYRLLDDRGVTVPYTVYFEIAEANDITDTVAAVQAFALLLDAVTGSQIIEQAVKITNIPLGVGLKSAPIANSKNPDAGSFSFDQASVKYLYTTSVPAIRDTLVVNDRINESAAAITAFTGELVTPGGVLAWVSQGVRDLTAWAASFLNTRKHRKQLKSRSAEVAP
jgi:hypothetical protein